MGNYLSNPPVIAYNPPLYNERIHKYNLEKINFMNVYSDADSYKYHHVPKSFICSVCRNVRITTMFYSEKCLFVCRECSKK